MHVSDFLSCALRQSRQDRNLASATYLERLSALYACDFSFLFFNGIKSIRSEVDALAIESRYQWPLFLSCAQQSEHPIAQLLTVSSWPLCEPVDGSEASSIARASVATWQALNALGAHKSKKLSDMGITLCVDPQTGLRFILKDGVCAKALVPGDRLTRKFIEQALRRGAVVLASQSLTVFLERFKLLFDLAPGYRIDLSPRLAASYIMDSRATSASLRVFDPKAAPDSEHQVDIEVRIQFDSPRAFLAASKGPALGPGGLSLIRGVDQWVSAKNYEDLAAAVVDRLSGACEKSFHNIKTYQERTTQWQQWAREQGLVLAENPLERMRS